MKKAIVSCAVLVLCLTTLPAFTDVQSSITGKVKPPDGTEAIWVISGKDSSRVTMVTGSFSVDVNPGIYKLVIDAKSPYQDLYMENLEVKPGMTLDLGEIFLKT
jgi:uncharacterized membrane protein